MKNLHRTYSNVPIIYQFHPSCQTVTETTPFATIKSSTGLTYNLNITMLDIKREVWSFLARISKWENVREKRLLMVRLCHQYSNETLKNQDSNDSKIQQVHIYTNAVAHYSQQSYKENLLNQKIKSKPESHKHSLLTQKKKNPN